ncbi:ion transporter [bacterium]|nr:ion transporter [bacterium]
MLKKYKSRLREILAPPRPDDKLSRVFDILLIALISLNIFAVILETIEPISSRYGKYFHIFELVTVILFTIEYLLRFWTASESKVFKDIMRNKLRFVFSPISLIDLFAILPFYLPVILPFDLRIIRGLRLFRIFRVLKMGRYSESFKMLGEMLKKKQEQLIASLFFIVILLIISSSLMYFVEKKAQPHEFSSILSAMWWGVNSVMKLSYIDIEPATLAGKIIGTVVAFLGVAIFALPTAIISSGLIEANKNRKAYVEKKCPHCGAIING